MQIEVLSDQYDEAIDRMNDRINQGRGLYAFAHQFFHGGELYGQPERH